MRVFLLTLLAAASMLGGCVSISAAPTREATPVFVTATLPDTSTPAATPSVGPTATPKGAATHAPCSERAVLIQDVTIPDNTRVAAGASFTKTWQFQNSGTCPWTGYTIVFASGDKLGAVDPAPVPDTLPGAKVNVSIQLTAPMTSAVYTGYFVLHDPAGQVVPVGIYQDFWVRILVGNASAPGPVLPPTEASGATPVSAPKGPGGCQYQVSWSYPGEITNLINGARTHAGLAKLAINAQLEAAAQGHSIDMACHSLLSHTGSDASTIYQRITAEGYQPANYLEIIFASGYPQDAFNWWMNDPVHHDAILSTGVTEMGAGYAYVADSAYGGYYTVDFGTP